MATVRDHTKSAISQLQPVLETLTGRVAEMIRAEIVESMRSGSPSGERRGLHVASAPGEVPAVHSEEYLKSWKTLAPTAEGGEVGAAVYSDKAVPGTDRTLAHTLEYGTLKMAPRPHIRPALDRVRAKLESELARGGE